MTELKTVANKNLTAGDDVRITITINNVPSGVSFVKGWISFKTSDTVADSSATLQKTVTSGFTQSGTTVTFSIDLSNVETLLFTPGISYRWDIQLKDSSSRLSTPISDGVVVWRKGITLAAS